MDDLRPLLSDRSDNLNRQSAMDLCSSVDDMEGVTDAQSFALAAVVEALIYVGDEIGRVADALGKERGPDA